MYKRQRLLFSATLDGDVDKLVHQFMHDPVTHSTAPVQAAVDSMEHYQLLVGTREARNDIVPYIAARDGKTVMFMRTKHGVDRQVKKLRRVGINAFPLHGDKGQGARTRAIEGFADGSIPVLVATDIAARGIDISDVSLVVHIDPPAEHKAYLHRAGRTARAGTSGTVVTLVMDDQRKEFDQLLRKAGVNATKVQVSAGDTKLAKITGARKPTGIPLPPPGQKAKAGQSSSPNHRSARGNKRRRGGNQSNRSGARRQKRSSGRNTRGNNRSF